MGSGLGAACTDKNTTILAAMIDQLANGNRRYRSGTPS
jgi:hypothetical protein